jgi:hypothetical protein
MPRNAFVEPCEDCGPGPQWFLGVGPIAWQRQRLGNGVIAVTEDGTGTGFNPDSGDNPPGTSPVAADFGSVPTDFHWGVQVTAARRLGCHILEFHGFYQSWQEDALSVTSPGRLSLPFSAFPPPQGFTGTNFLWSQADQVVVRYGNQVASAEANLRTVLGPYVECICGVRYFDVREEFSIFTDDDGVTSARLRVPPDPLRMATYGVQTINRIAGPQIGLEAEKWLVPGFAVGLTSKNMVGVNFLEVSQELVRGDGFRGPSGSRSETDWAGVFELGAYFTWELNNHIRLRAGYNALWVVNVPEAQAQVDFDPNVAGGRRDDNGSIFFHGPSLELRLAF